jgi:hypothetical protein
MKRYEKEEGAKNTKNMASHNFQKAKKNNIECESGVYIYFMKKSHFY